MKELKNVEGYVRDVNKLKSVAGYWTPEGLVYRGKPIRAGIFVDVTCKTEEEKDKLFKLAREEIGKEGEGEARGKKPPFGFVYMY